MFKVTFTRKRDVHKFDNITKYILWGEFKLPEFWVYIPKHIKDWVVQRGNTKRFHLVFSKDTCILMAVGKASCHENDKYDTVLGERLAECRAKQVTYEFFATLCSKLYEYYATILYGGRLFPDQNGVSGSLNKVRLKYAHLLSTERKHEQDLLNQVKDGQPA